MHIESVFGVSGNRTSMPVHQKDFHLLYNICIYQSSCRTHTLSRMAAHPYDAVYRTENGMTLSLTLLMTARAFWWMPEPPEVRISEDRRAALFRVFVP